MNDKYLLYLSGVLSENQFLGNQGFSGMSDDHKKVEEIFNFVNKAIVNIKDENIKKSLQNILGELNGILLS